MQNAGVSDALITDYIRTCYQVGGSDNFTKVINLRINLYSESMHRLLVEQNVACAAIITAYNPFSQIQSRKSNMASHELLLATLQPYSAFMVDSTNIDPTGIWPDEKSICIFGLSLESARPIGRQFNQNAIVWIGNDAVPQLILLS